MPLELMVDGQVLSLPGLVLLGAIVGFVAGAFGIGGGFLLTPLLVVVFRVPLSTAVGTSLCQIVGTAVAALLRHQRLGQGELRFDLLMLPGSLLGVEAGARTLSALTQAGSIRLGSRSVPAVNLIVEGLYAVALLAVAATYWKHARQRRDVLALVRPGPLARWGPPPRVRLPAVPLQGVSTPVVGYLGLAMGFLGGLMGIGGGVALMPVLLYGFGFPFRQAAGTGIVVLVATSGLGTVSHALRGHVHLGLAMVLLIGSTVSAQFGAMATRRFSARSLARLHAAVVASAVLAILWDLARRLR